MNHSQFCSYYGREGKTGRVIFNRNHIKEFIETYTDVNFYDLDKNQIFLTKSFMIDLYERRSKVGDREDSPIDKISLPEYILK